MAVDRFLIAPLNSGLQDNVRPWLIMDDAFSQLTNAYNWRGLIRRRPGSRAMVSSVASKNQQQFSRLRINVGNTDADTGNFGPAVMPGAIGKEGQLFSVGNTYFTVYQSGATYTTGAATATYVTATRTLTITGNAENPTTAVYFYPSEPVMHFASYENAGINDEETIAFDTQFAYTFAVATGWTRLGAGIWTGTDADFFSSTNYRGINAYDYLLFVTNNVVADQIKYWNGAAWESVSPVYNNASDNVIRTSKLVASFKDRLLLLNTIEQTEAGDQSFVNRIRFSQNGSPIADDAFHEDVAGKGGFIEAPTREAIVAYEFVKDRLIIFFERSTFELVYTGNEILPFRFQKLDAELGVESQNSVIFFDKVALGFGSTGIHACNGLNVERIDALIPEQVFDIQNDESGPQRVTGIRDYDAEIVYWSYPSSIKSTDSADKFPNNILAYNYTNNTWSEFNDSITAFGYFQLNEDLTWDNLDVEWQESEDIWADPSLQALYRNVVAGNQEGFVFIMDPDRARNAQSLQISNIAVAANIITITVYDHNFNEDDYVYINNVEGDDASYDDFNDVIFPINSIIDDDSFTILLDDITGNYEGGGTISIVSPIDILSKEYNFYNKIGQNMFIQEVQFYVDRTVEGLLGLAFYPSSSPLNIYAEGVNNGYITGSAFLQTFGNNAQEDMQVQLWRSAYPNAEGQNISFRISEPVTQNNLPLVNSIFTDFQLHAILFKVSPTYEL